MSGVDYSKWDKMANEMSDSDEENDNRPEVTTFDEPQSVTFGGTPASQTSGGSDGPGTHSSSSDAAAPIDGSAEAAATAAGAAATTAPRPKVQAPVTDEQLTQNGAAVYRTVSGGRRVLHYVWRQARAEVTVVVPVPPGTRAADVQVSLTAKPETIAEGVADLIQVSVKSTREAVDGVAGASGATAMGDKEEALVVLLEGELAFQAKLEAEGGGDADWELKDFPGTVVARDSPASAGDGPAATGEACARSAAVGDRRGIEVVLRKHCPVPNATVWWKSVLKGGPEIDVSVIQGRATNNHQSVWEEALGMFKDKVAARKAKGKISVDMGEGHSISR